MSTGAPSIVGRIALVTCGLIAGVIAADVGLRFLDPPRLAGKRQLLPGNRPFGFQCYPDNPHGDFAPAPRPEAGWTLYELADPPVPLPLSRLAETPWCVRYDVSPQGLRGPVVPPRPATGTVRIVGIGDSFAIGEGVPADKSVFAHLDRALDPRAEVLNAGRSGYDTYRELRLLRQLATQLHPQRSLVVFLLNDVWMPKHMRAKQRWINDLVNVRRDKLWGDGGRPWWHASVLLRWIDSWRRMRAITDATVQWYRDAWDPKKNPEGVDAFIRDVKLLAKVDGVRPAMVLYPMLLQLDAYPFADIHDQVAAIAKDAGIPVLDLAPAFAGKQARSLHVHSADHHPNSAAHKHAAETIAAWLKTLPGYLDTDE